LGTLSELPYSQVLSRKTVIPQWVEVIICSEVHFLSARLKLSHVKLW